MLLAAAEAGQSTPGQPDRDTESIIGVELATNTLGVVDVQSVKHVKSTPQCKLSSCATELWNAWSTYHDHGGDCGLVKQRDGSGAVTTRTAEDVTRCLQSSTRQGTLARAKCEKTRRTWIAEACLNTSSTR